MELAGSALLMADSLRKEGKSMKKAEPKKVEIKMVKMPVSSMTCRNPSNCH